MIDLREPSTKRGIVWIVGGVTVLIQAFRGRAVDTEALFSNLDFWLGLIMTVAGGLGLLPDEKPASVRIELPPVSLVGRQESGFGDRSGTSVVASDSVPAAGPDPVRAGPPAGRLPDRRPVGVSDKRGPRSGESAGDEPPGWNG